MFIYTYLLIFICIINLIVVVYCWLFKKLNGWINNGRNELHF